MKKYVITILVLLGVAIFAVEKTTYRAEPQKFASIVRLHDRVSGKFFCSGTAISDKIIITAAHCVFGTSPLDIDVHASSGAQTGALVYEVKADPRSDQALLIGNFEMFNARPIETRPTELLEVYKTGKLVVCGYPYGGPLFCEKVKFQKVYIFHIMTDGAAWPGMSGGPLLNADTGEVIGLITAMSEEGMILTPTTYIFYHLGLIEVKPKSSN